MTTKILTREESALVEAGRRQTISPLGDLWVALKCYGNDDAFNEMAVQYNSIEDNEIDAVIDAGGTVMETYGNGDVKQISKAPNRPKPPVT
ncbi:MAG TPA: hypothetical protein PK511_11765 [Chitinophagales bacterium]|nr:hypothetical protein [Cyclobacteriaceae bacterium]HMY34605.1 hypothetical protein [bacterium]HNI55192.1 hypothetical protein [Chitinophagales bacterium]HMY95694.1 hypothetical protein [Cyclobacteriaceae bacterium]HNA14774.1 hypothetical protein [Cyclobacteriaceae bacterium]